MKLSELKKKGGLIDETLVKKSGVWKHFDEEKGEIVEDKVEFFVRKAGYLEFTNAISSARSSDKGLNPDCLAIAACVRLGEKGEESIPYEDACCLDTALMNLFKEKMSEVYAPKN